MIESPLDMPRIWIEFTDPETTDHEVPQLFRCDVTWLTSFWTCIYGRGCLGIDAALPDAGCCVHGAHFTEQSDHDHVSQYVAQLDPATWQRHAAGTSADGWTELEDDSTKTRVINGACIFHNDAGFSGGQGCALHHLAGRTGLAPYRTKPEVCWQLPIRRAYRTVELADGSSYLETTIGEYDRRAWGPGGHDFPWYCSGSPTAHVGAVPVYRSYEMELRELMGSPGYTELAKQCAAHERLVEAASSEITDGMAVDHQHHITGPKERPLLPLLVHPATLSAKNPAAFPRPDDNQGK
ncbi:MAG: hypothetical protein ACRCTR_03070 [Actinomycetota bacterium]